MAQAVKAKFSKNYEAVKKRIQRLPKIIGNVAEGRIKKDLNNVIEEYRLGLKRNNFGLQQLNDFTVGKKSEAGYTKPRSPLYGAGESQRNSLYNALAIRKIKKGWRLYKRRAKHHSADLPLNVLLSIHENGAIIQVTEKMRKFLHWYGLHLRNDTLYIRIPPRPIVDKAIQRMLRKKMRKEQVGKVKKAMIQLIKTGHQSELNKMARYSKKHEAGD